MEIFGAYVVGVLMITLVYIPILRKQRERHAVEIKLALLAIEAWKMYGAE